MMSREVEDSPACAGSPPELEAMLLRTIEDPLSRWMELPVAAAEVQLDLECARALANLGRTQDARKMYEKTRPKIEPLLSWPVKPSAIPLITCRLRPSL